MAEENYISDDLMLGRLCELGQRSELNARIEIEWSDEGELPLRLTLNGGDVAALGDGEAVDIIVRTDKRTLQSVLDGRASFGDLLVAERIRLSGDLAKLAKLKMALELLTVGDR